MPKKKGYSEDSMQRAIDAVRSGRASVRAAAKEYGVVRMTLAFRLSSKFKKVSCGPSTVLTTEEEDVLLEWIEKNQKVGFLRDAFDLETSVRDFLEQSKRPNPFVDNMPGRGWMRAFHKRHKEKLSWRKPESVSFASACVSEADIRGWFKSIEDALKELNLLDILKDPRRVFHGDETSFLLCVLKHLVLAVKGSKNVYSVDGGEAKAAITVMFSFSAAGQMVPPMLIYPYQRIPAEVVKDVPKNWGVGRSESGWMTSETFYEYIGSTFNDFLNQNDIQRPVILFVDGHKTHLTLQVSQLCTELQIVLVALYPNATRILQPADVSLFSPLKSGWKREVSLWRQENPLEPVTKRHVAPLLDRVLKRKDFSAACVSGFKATGLYPWNPDGIDYSKCLGQHNEKPADVPAQQTNPCEIKTLSLEKFSAIVGEEKTALFKTMQDQGQAAGENTLYRLWLEFFEPGRVPTANSGAVPPNDSGEIATQDSEAAPTESSQAVMQDAGDSQDSPTPPSTSQPQKSLRDHLQWPGAPKRKGVRNVERMPYVISSANYQKILEDKANKKAEEEARKEDRKRKREEERIAREEEKRRKQEERQRIQEEKRKAREEKETAQRAKRAAAQVKTRSRN